MSWMTDLADPAALRERAIKSACVPVGLANPLWLAFGAAASAGAAWWLMTRWTRPFNAEAVFGFLPASPAAAKPVAAAAVVEDAPAPAAPAVAETIAAPAEAVVEGPPAQPATDETLAEGEAPAVEPAEVVETAEPVADELTRLVGVGPRTAAALMERGVTRFADLAAWTEEEMAAFDAEMNLKGRSVRDAWLAQARRLATEA